MQTTASETRKIALNEREKLSNRRIPFQGELFEAVQSMARAASDPAAASQPRNEVRFFGRKVSSRAMKRPRHVNVTMAKRGRESGTMLPIDYPEDDRNGMNSRLGGG